MKTDNLSEKESLELISRMILSTRNSLGKGSGNIFLIYGYTGLALSAAVFLTVSLTGKPGWAALWFMMFLPYVILPLANQDKEGFTTYIGRSVNVIWKVVGWAFCLTAAILFILSFMKDVDWSLMLPLALIYSGMGTAMTGIALNEKSLVWPAAAALIIALVMLSSGISPSAYWHLVFGGGMLASMIIPGHIINMKAVKEQHDNIQQP